VLHCAFDRWRVGRAKRAAPERALSGSVKHSEQKARLFAVLASFLTESDGNVKRSEQEARSFSTVRSNVVAAFGGPVPEPG
ncbi:hypothetical protein WAH63_21725, partial [Acinetobacter baumannii]